MAAVTSCENALCLQLSFFLTLPDVSTILLFPPGHHKKKTRSLVAAKKIHFPCSIRSFWKSLKMLETHRVAIAHPAK